MQKDVPPSRERNSNSKKATQALFSIHQHATVKPEDGCVFSHTHKYAVLVWARTGESMIGRKARMVGEHTSTTKILVAGQQPVREGIDRRANGRHPKRKDQSQSRAFSAVVSCIPGDSTIADLNVSTERPTLE